jgi:Phage integrase family
MLLLTGQRRNEIAEMTWNEIDLEKALLVIPPERMKNNSGHEVPLSQAAIALLERLPRWQGGDFVFSSTGGKSAIRGFSKVKSCIDARWRQGGRMDVSRFAQDDENGTWRPADPGQCLRTVPRTQASGHACGVRQALIPRRKAAGAGALEREAGGDHRAGPRSGQCREVPHGLARCARIGRPAEKLPRAG